MCPCVTDWQAVIQLCIVMIHLKFKCLSPAATQGTEATENTSLTEHSTKSEKFMCHAKLLHTYLKMEGVRVCTWSTILLSVLLAVDAIPAVKEQW